MSEALVTADDLAMIAMGLLEGGEQAKVEAVLDGSTAAREELANIRGDLSLFALAVEQQTPPPLTRQRLLQQIGRERRLVPVVLPVEDDREQEAVPPVADREETLGSSGTAGSPGEIRVRQRGLEARRALSGQGAAQERALDPGAIPTATLPVKPAGTRSFPARIASETGSSPEQEGSPRDEFVARGRSAPEEASNDILDTEFTDRRQMPALESQARLRDAGDSVSISVPAHSVTMFEQHFAGAPEVAEGSGEAWQQGASRTGSTFAADVPLRKSVDEAIDRVQDRFVPTGMAAEGSGTFAFTSYRERSGAAGEPNRLGQWLSWLGWAVAAALAVVAVLAFRDEFQLREQISRQQSAGAAAQAKGARAETVVDTLESPSAQQFVLGRTDAAPAPSGHVAYLPERGSLVFQGNNLETLQPYRTYELWLIPAAPGSQPIPAGLFKPDGHGYASILLPQMPKGVVAANFGVTIEDDGGSASPTLPILLVGQQQ